MDDAPPVCPEHHLPLQVEEDCAYHEATMTYWLWCAVTCPACERTVGLFNELKRTHTWYGKWDAALATDKVARPHLPALREATLECLQRNLDDGWQHYDALIPLGGPPYVAGSINATMHARIRTSQPIQ